MDEQAPAAPTPLFVQFGFVMSRADLDALKVIAVRKRTTVAALLGRGIAVILENEGVPASSSLAQVGRRRRGRPPGR